MGAVYFIRGGYGWQKYWKSDKRMPAIKSHQRFESVGSGGKCRLCGKQWPTGAKSGSK
jgi:hypothetical protein